MLKRLRQSHSCRTLPWQMMLRGLLHLSRIPRSGTVPTPHSWCRWRMCTYRYWLPSAAVFISVVPPILPQLTEAGFAMPALAGVVAVGVTFVTHPSFRNRVHSSQLVPLGNVHMPYWPPSAAVLISVVPPILPQLTEAGFDILAVTAAVGASVAEVVATGVATVGVVVWTAAGACCCVHPATSKPAMRQAKIITKILVLDIMIIPDTISMPRIKRSSE